MQPSRQQTIMPSEDQRNTPTRRAHPSLEPKASKEKTSSPYSRQMQHFEVAHKGQGLPDTIQTCCVQVVHRVCRTHSAHSSSTYHMALAPIFGTASPSCAQSCVPSPCAPQTMMHHTPVPVRSASCPVRHHFGSCQVVDDLAGQTWHIRGSPEQPLHTSLPAAAYQPS